MAENPYVTYPTPMMTSPNTSIPTGEELSQTFLAASALDRTIVWTSLSIGIPGNILIILIFTTFPKMASTFMLKCMAGFDTASLVLLTSIRFLDWGSVVSVKGAAENIGWTIYFNSSNFVSIFANNVFILIMMERLIFIRFPEMKEQYISMDRVKLNLAIFLILFASFCIVVIVKMHYFGVAWIFVFTVFYSLWPALGVLLMFALIISHYHNVHAERVKMERNKKLFPSQASNVNKSPSKYSGFSGTGSGGAGSVTGSTGTHLKKKDPYGSVLLNKSASESYLSAPSKLASSTSTGTINKINGGKGSNLKVPQSSSANPYAIAHLIHGGGVSGGDGTVAPGSEDSDSDAEMEEMERQMTRCILSIAVIFIILMVPVCFIYFLFIQDNNDHIDPSTDHSAFLMITIVLFLTLFWHAAKFIVYFICSALFRRGILAIFKSKPKIVIEPEAV